MSLGPRGEELGNITAENLLEPTSSGKGASGDDTNELLRKIHAAITSSKEQKEQKEQLDYFKRSKQGKCNDVHDSQVEAAIKSLESKLTEIFTQSRRVIKNQDKNRSTGGGGKTNVKDVGVSSNRGLAKQLDIEHKVANATEQTEQSVGRTNKKIRGQLTLEQQLVKTISRASGPISDQVRWYFQQGKAREKDFAIARKMRLFEHGLTKDQKRQQEDKQIAIDRAGSDPVKLAKAMQDYYDWADAASDKAKNNLGTWGKTKDVMLTVSKAAFTSTANTANAAYDLGKAWGSPVTESLKYSKNLNEVGYRLGKNLKTLKESVDADIIYGDRLTMAAQTGKGMADYQKTSLQLVQHGIKDQQKVVSASKTSLKLATDIGVSVDDTAGLLGDWVQKYKLSGTEAMVLGRGMKDIAQNTGLAGAELLTAIKSAEKITDIFRLMGINSSSVLQNITQIVASGQKFGVGDQMSELLQGTSSLATVMKDSKMAMKVAMVTGNDANLSQEDRQKMMYGGGLAQDKNLQKVYAQDTKQMIADVTRQAAGQAGVDTTGWDTKTKEEQIAIANSVNKEFVDLQFKLRNFAGGVGQASAEVDTFNESSKTFAQKVAEGTQEATSPEDKAAWASKKKSMESTEQISQMQKLVNAAKSNQLDKFDYKELSESIAAMDQNSPQTQILKQLAADAQAGHIDIKEVNKNIKTFGEKANESDIKDLANGDVGTAAEIEALKNSQKFQQLTGGWIHGMFETLRPTGVLMAFLLSNLAAGPMGQLLGKGLWKAGAWGLSKMGIGGAKVAAGGAKVVAGGARVGEEVAGGAKALGFGARTMKFLGPVGRVLGPVAKGLGMIGRVAGKIALPLTIALGVWDGVTGAMSGASKAAENFNVSQDKVTTGMKVASGAAAGITGVFNGLTFGFFDKQLGPNGTWTKAISGFFYSAGNILSDGWDMLSHLWGSGQKKLAEETAAANAKTERVSADVHKDELNRFKDMTDAERKEKISISKQLLEGQQRELKNTMANQGWFTNSDESIKGNKTRIAGLQQEIADLEAAQRATPAGKGEGVRLDPMQVAQKAAADEAAKKAAITSQPQTTVAAAVDYEAQRQHKDVAGAIGQTMSHVRTPGQIGPANQPTTQANPITPGTGINQDKVESRLRQERATNAGEPGKQDATRGMTNVEKNTAEQLKLLRDIDAQLKLFVSVMKQPSTNTNKSNKGRAGNPQANKLETRPGRTKPWTQNYGMSPSRNISMT